MPSQECYFCAFSYAITLMKDSLGALRHSSAASTPLPCTLSHAVIQALCLCEMNTEANTMFHGQSSRASPHTDPGCLSPFCPVARGSRRSLLPMVTCLWPWGLIRNAGGWQRRPWYPLPGDDHRCREHISILEPVGPEVVRLCVWTKPVSCCWGPG